MGYAQGMPLGPLQGRAFHVPSAIGRVGKMKQDWFRTWRVGTLPSYPALPGCR